MLRSLHVNARFRTSKLKREGRNAPRRTHRSGAAPHRSPADGHPPIRFFLTIVAFGAVWLQLEEAGFRAVERMPAFATVMSGSGVWQAARIELPREAE
jgi:hypothetical protein